VRRKKKKFAGGRQQNPSDRNGRLLNAKQDRGSGAASAEQPCEEECGSEGKSQNAVGPRGSALGMQRRPVRCTDFRADIDKKQDAQKYGDSGARDAGTGLHGCVIIPMWCLTELLPEKHHCKRDTKHSHQVQQWRNARGLNGDRGERPRTDRAHSPCQIGDA